jgi:hypothetical protein
MSNKNVYTMDLRCTTCTIRTAKHININDGDNKYVNLCGVCYPFHNVKCNWCSNLSTHNNLPFNYIDNSDPRRLNLCYSCYRKYNDFNKDVFRYN